MPTPSGQIGLQDVNLELSKSATALIAMNDTDVRNLAQKPGSGTIISMNDLRGKSATFTAVVTSNVSVLAGGQTATITFVTSDITYDFGNGSVSVSAGSLSALSTSNYKTFTGTYTPPTNSNGTVNIFVPANTFTNANTGANNTVSNTVQISYDTLQPTMSITAGSTNLGIGQTTVITFTSSESTSNFTLADVTVSSGSLTSFSGSGTTYTATYTPPANSSASATISVASGTFSDSFGNINPASNTLTINYNTLPAPTYSLTRNVANVNETTSPTVTYTVTTTNFGTGTLYWSHVTGAGFADSNDMTDFLDIGSVSVNNNSGSFTRTLRSDAFTEGTETLRVQLRTGSTSGTVVATALDVSIGDTSTTPATSISPTSIANGTVGTYYFEAFEILVNGSPTPATFSYTGTLPPGMSFGGNELAFGPFFYDAALSGVPNTSGTYSFTVYATTNTSFSANRTYTVTIFSPPTVTISTNNANLGIGQTAQLTFQMNTNAFGFTQSDISVSAGSISNFSGGDGSTSFTATYTPPANSSGTANISVPAGAFLNNLGGSSAASNNLQISYTTVVPTVYNPLAIHADQISGADYNATDMFVGVIFYKDGRYATYANGLLNTYDWITPRSSTSGVGKYVRFIFNPSQSSISPTGGYGSSPSNLATNGGTSGWMEILGDGPPGTTTNAPFVYVVETGNNYYLTQSYINVTIQISTSPTGSPIVSQSTVVFLAESWIYVDQGGA
jgi:hypothetical protein